MEERSIRVFFLVAAFCVLPFLHHCDATEYDHKVNKPLYYKTPFWFVQLFLAVMITLVIQVHTCPSQNPTLRVQNTLNTPQEVFT
jgi:hypothetical protein